MCAAPIQKLAELANGEEADFFAQLTEKQTLTTKEGNPYYRVTFRDAGREVSFPIWNDAPLADDCRERWEVGTCFKIRALYRETNYGPQLDIRRIRPVEEADHAEGFSPALCMPFSRFDPQEMMDDLTALAEEGIDDAPLRRLVMGIYEANRESLLVWPAAVRNHHAFGGGFLEHVRMVAQNAYALAQQYDARYPDMQPRLHVGVVVAGALLHDIGKLRELATTSGGAEYTAAGNLIGHILQGRDIVREAAAQQAEEGDPIDAALLLRLEHVIVSHQRLPEWGSPKPPMTPEALLVHYADDCDAKYQMMLNILADDATQGPMTGRRNVLGHAIYRGEEPSEPSPSE